jgi:hypothetical protein
VFSLVYLCTWVATFAVSINLLYSQKNKKLLLVCMLPLFMFDVSHVVYIFIYLFIFTIHFQVLRCLILRIEEKVYVFMEEVM